jgi:ATP-dependent Clp protease ATP-binding subunit ClpB
MKNAVMDIVQQHFKPEFINRVDDMVVFHPLGKEQIRAHREAIQPGTCAAPGRARDPLRSSTPRRSDLLGEAGFDPVYGARPLKRAIQHQIENPLAQEILRGRSTNTNAESATTTWRHCRRSPTSPCANAPSAAGTH